MTPVEELAVEKRCVRFKNTKLKIKPYGES